MSASSKRRAAIVYELQRSRGWIIVIAAALLPAALWLNAADLETRFGAPAAALKSLANLSALTGTSMFALIMILGARLKLVDRLLGGFERMYRIHRVLGYAVPAVLVGHAILVISSRAMISLAAGLILLTPAAGWNVFLGVIALAALIVMLLIPLLRQLKHETFVALHRLVGVVFVLGSLHVLLVPATWALPALLITYLLGLLLLGTLAFVYRSVFGRLLVRRYRHRVEQVNQLGSTAVEIVLSPLEDALNYQSGQFVFLTILDKQLPSETHPFSIVSVPNEQQVRIVIKSLGDYTAQILELEPGGEALIEGPYGGFSYTNVGNPRQIWIAGGIGMTPFLSMARSLGSAAYDIDLYYCTERAEDSYYLDELFEIADQNTRLRVVPISKTSLGHITSDDIRVASGDLAKQDIFICGPPVMIQNLRRQFADRGVPKSQIHFEDFSVISV